ncbi:glycosyltransferase [Tsukamurella sp. NPDC003166]|uniref:glycosyltransferase family 2 protein n=1 Tax=Tsukamurella sp. NPDC003166 TaxID=3154444 RepID=UPI0033A85E93
MTNGPRIAVITAVLPQSTDYLDSAYESLRRQDLLDWEWSIVFDGTGGAVSDRIATDSRVLINHNPERRGVAHGRNSAILASSAPILRNLDADDALVEVDALSTVVHALSDESVGFHLSATVDREEDGSDSVFAAIRTEPGRMRRGYWADEWITRRYLDVRANTLAVRRDLYWYVGGYRAMQFAEDVSLIAALNEVSEGWYEPRALSMYRKWPGQTSAGTRPWEFEASYTDITRAILSARRHLQIR